MLRFLWNVFIFIDNTFGMGWVLLLAASYLCLHNLEGFIIFIDAIFVLLAIVAWAQPNIQRNYAAFVFIGITLSHQYVFGDLDGLMFYLSAAFLDLLIIIITAGINPVTKMVITLQKISLFSIVSNMVGYILWYFYFNPTLYDSVYIVLYLRALMAFIDRDREEESGGYNIRDWHLCFRWNHYLFIEYIRRHGFKI